VRSGIFVIGFLIIIVGVILWFSNIPVTSSTTFNINTPGPYNNIYFASSAINIKSNTHLTLEWNSNLNITVGIVSQNVWNSFNSTGDSGNINSSAIVYGYGIKGNINVNVSNEQNIVVYTYVRYINKYLRVNYTLEFSNVKSFQFMAIPVFTGGVLTVIFSVVVSSPENKEEKQEYNPSSLSPIYQNIKSIGSRNTYNTNKMYNSKQMPTQNKNYMGGMHTNTTKQVEEVNVIENPDEPQIPLIKLGNVKKEVHRNVSITLLCPVCGQTVSKSDVVCPHCNTVLKPNKMDK
jgi:rubrerythrin